MITLDIEKSDCKNAGEMIEMYFFQNIKDLLDMEELDNIEYLRSMIKVLDELQKASKGEENENQT